MPPGKPATIRGLSFVLPKKIAKDYGALRIGGDDFSPAVNQAMCLVEIYRLQDIGWN